MSKRRNDKMEMTNTGKSAEKNQMNVIIPVSSPTPNVNISFTCLRLLHLF
jgi:hypothetical protein